MVVAIDDNGFIRDQTIDVGFTITMDGKAQDNHILLHQTYDAINQASPLTKEIPKNVKSFDEILKFITSRKKIDLRQNTYLFPRGKYFFVLHLIEI